jgi:hypothetical protein
MSVLLHQGLRDELDTVRLLLLSGLCLTDVLKVTDPDVDRFMDEEGSGLYRCDLGLERLKADDTGQITVIIPKRMGSCVSMGARYPWARRDTEIVEYDIELLLAEAQG